MALVDGIKAVAVSGTAEKLASSFTPAAWLMLYGHDDNAGLVYVGGPDVVAAIDGTERGIRLQQLGESGTEHPLFIPGPLDLNKVWLDVGTGADSVTFLYDDNASPILAGS